MGPATAHPRGDRPTGLDPGPAGPRVAQRFTTQSAVASVQAAVDEAAEATGGDIDLVGVSLGGMVALHAAAAAPEAIAHVVAANCSTQPSRATASLYAWGVIALHRLPGSPARSGGPLLRRLLGEAGAAAYVRGGTADGPTVRQTLQTIAGWDLRADLAALQIPVTLLNSRFDQLRMNERSFARAAPRGRLVSLDHGTHLAPLSDPARWTAALIEVLDTLPQ